MPFEAVFSGSGFTDSRQSTGSRLNCDMPEIGDLDDIVDVMELCDEHDVPYDGLEDMEEFIERLRLHFFKMRYPESRKAQIEKTMHLAGSDDTNRRKKLASVMTEMLSIIHRHGSDLEVRRDSQLVEGLLKTEGTTENLEADCLAHIESMEHGECVVIVAGETSAGKSSVLNLLFEGDNILPVHNNSSTSTITIIRYDTRKHARIVYKTGKPDDEFDLDQEGLNRLHAIAFMKSASEREHHNIQQVQVFLPLPLLKSGLVLVDTPGIGENEFLEAELTNFIKDNTILGFMYIIKTDNAGGVQEDRLLGLLKIVLDMQKTSTKLIKFDPKSALFVCNRVDLVDKNELDRVKQNAIDKLSECWPGFVESQVIFFSTEKALRDITADKDYINDNYRQFLDSLKNMFISSMERRIKQTFKWIENVLKRTNHHLRTVVKRLDLSDMDLKERSDTAREKLVTLGKKSDAVFKKMRSDIGIECNLMCSELREFLKSEYCKKKLLDDWSSHEIPDVDSGLGDWPWIRSRIHEAFFDKLITCVGEWDKNERRMDKIEESLSCQIKLELLLLEEELKDIEKEIRGDSSSCSSDDMSELSKSRRKSMPRMSSGRSKFLINEPKMPMKLAGRVIEPFKQMITSVKDGLKVSKYTSTPIEVAKDCAKKFYEEFLRDSDKGLVPLAEYLLERPREYIDAVERRVPGMILANELLVNRLEEMAESERQHLSEYEEMMMSTEVLKKSLMEYGEGYIFVADFSRGELQIQQFSEEGRRESVAFNVTDFLRGSSGDLGICKRRDIRGLWTVTYGGVLNRNEVERPVAIKVYLPSSGVSFTYKEVAKLRCLTWHNTNVAEFLGIHNAEALTPAFVFNGDLKSVRKSLSGFCNRRECVPEILTGTACGLEYLHKKGLVHMELTQDTITVDDNGEVQLTGACLPRTPKLPMDTESIETGDFVYLAPEILRGDKYEACADIYSFGLLIIELTQVDMPLVFVQQRRMTLCDFISQVDPEEMLELEKTVEVFTIRTRALIINCLEKNKGDRPMINEVVEFTSYIQNESEALSKLTNRRTKGPIKRSSTGSKSLKEMK